MAPGLGAEALPRRLLWGILALVLAGVIAGGALWSGSRPGATWGVPAEGPSAPGDPLPDFALTAEDGSAFTRADLLGKVWIAGFIYTRCTTLCPRVTARMAKLRATGVSLVSFSVDPDWDRPEVLRLYAAEHGAAAPGWHFLTGDREALTRLGGQGFRLSLSPAPPSSGELVIHSDRLVLLDTRARIRGSYSCGDSEAIGRLLRDVESVRREP